MDDKGPVYRAKIRLALGVLAGLVLFFVLGAVFAQPYI